MTLTLMVITDGRSHCLSRTMSTLDLCVDATAIDRRICVNDCPDRDYGKWIDKTFNFDRQLRTHTRRGFAGAIIAGWNALDDTDWVLHLEDDFMWTRYVNLRAMISVLDRHPQLAQMALRRQAWSDEEKAAGGIVELHPDAYTDTVDLQPPNYAWLEHRLFFTTNPSIYPISTTAGGWPHQLNSEGLFSQRLFTDPERCCGYWGRRTDPPWVEHIGIERIGTGYW